AKPLGSVVGAHLLVGGDLLLIVAADEEMGAHYGAKWLCEERPDAVRCDMVINEGAGEMARYDGRRLFTLAVGEKGVFRFKLHARGVAGHGSIPGVGDNALLKLAEPLRRLREQPARESTADTDLFLKRLLGPDHGGPDRGLATMRARDPEFAGLLAEPMLGVTLAPTMAAAAPASNMIPSHAELTVDCRVPPEMEEAEVRERIASVLGDAATGGDWDIEFIEDVVGNRSDYGGPLAEAIEAWVGEVDPEAEVLPMVMPGFSDSHWFRKAFGATVYGFCPQSTMPLTLARSLVHSADERVPIADVELMTDCFYQLPKRVMGTAGAGDE
ncbi:MAG TPA: M20/M25/M40 family metallo-hydrolase, partial [Solirubrobacterales bacterium]|nr:M20/M25/M40 family metallo-hydrolase [Solirubrobacterales bacterium]